LPVGSASSGQPEAFSDKTGKPDIRGAYPHQQPDQALQWMRTGRLVAPPHGVVGPAARLSTSAITMVICRRARRQVAVITEKGSAIFESLPPSLWNFATGFTKT
jgi:hypothetical protein